MHFLAQAQKIKKVHPGKNSLYFRKWNVLSGSNIKKFQEMENPKNIPNNSGNLKKASLKIFLILQEIKTAQKLKFSQKKISYIFYISYIYFFSCILGNGNLQKILYIWGNETLLYSKNRNPEKILYFRK